MGDLADPNDLGASFQAHRDAMGTDALIAEARARQAAAAADKPAGPGAAAPAPTRTGTVRPSADGGVSFQVQDQPASDNIMGVTPLPAGSKPPPAPPGAKVIFDKAGNRITYTIDQNAGNMTVLSVVKGAAAKVGAVASDVAGGIIHSPMQVLGGVGDAARNAFMAADHLGDWLNDNVADLRVGGSTGSAGGDIAAGHPLAAIAAGIPKAPEAGSVTGGLIRDTAEFLTGFLPAMRAAKAIGFGKAAGSVAAGSAASATVMDPMQQNLSNLVEKYPALHNPVTDYLATKPDDSEGESRFKKAVEGAGLGALTEGFVLAVRALRAARMANVKPGAVADNLDAARAVHGSLSPEDTMIGGTAPDAPLVTVQQLAAAKLDTATAATETGVPDQVAASGVARSAADAASATSQTVDNRGTSDLRTAIVDENGVTHIGEPGEIHADLAERIRPDRGMLAADSEKWQIGFAGPDGKFLTRDQAARAAGVDTRAAGSREADVLVGKPVIGQPKVMINFDRINTADDVKQVIADTVQAFAPGIDAARRGIRSNEATQEAADALGMSANDLLARRRGQPMNAEEAVAARGLWAASADKLLELANAAAAPNAGAVDLFKFRRMLAVHYAIQAEVIGARTETARALQSWSMPVGGGSVERARALEQLLDANGGADVSNLLAKRIAALGKAGVDPAAMNAAIRQGAFAKTVDTVREIWINGLLSSPTTHIVNTTSNAVTAMAQIYERAVAGQYSTLIGRSAAEGGVMPGEASAMTYGLVAGLKDAFVSSWKSMVSGETGQTLGKIDVPQRAISSEAYGIASGTPLGHTVDFIGNAFRIPGRALGAEDEFFKSIGYRMELQAQAYRQGSQEGLTGPELTSRIADIVANPPENIRLAAADQALYQTFNNQPGAWGKAIMDARGKIPPLALVLPFVRTPINILRYGLERGPFALLVRQWRADVAAGGARADLAIARMGTGSAIMGLAFDYAEAGVVSGRGPSDPGARQALVRQGWQPYSIFVNGKWYSYNRMDPFGMTMGFAADFAETLRQGQPTRQEDVSQFNQILAGGIAMIGNNVVNKTYLQGFANFVTMMQDPTRYAEPYVNNLLASFVPYSGALRTAERFDDPTVRAARGMDEDTLGGPLLAQIESGLPGLSQNLVPERDLWGKEIKPDNAYGRAYDVLSPVKVTTVKTSPVDAEMYRLGYTPTRIPLKASIVGVPIDMGRYPQAYDDWVRLAGNDLKLQQYDNLGAKDFLDRVITGKSGNWSQIYKIYSDGPEGGKADFIKGVISEYRQAAANKVLSDPRFGDLRRVYDSRRAAMEVNKMPIPMQQQMPAGGLPAPVMQ